MEQLELKNVKITYDNSLVVDDVSFKIEQGDYVCIIGENGSGKSTLVKGILGLEKIKSGKIEYKNGISKSDIGYLPQQTIIQKDFPASVYEIVLSGCLNSPTMKLFYTKKEKEIANVNIKKLGLEPIQHKSYKELSGGQQQRVLLARALCSTRKMLVLDEPIAGLDPVITKQMYDIVKKINEEGITILMVSHDIRFAIEHANKIVHMQTKMLFQGETAEYVNTELGKTFLGGNV